MSSKRRFDILASPLGALNTGKYYSRATLHKHIKYHQQNSSKLSNNFKIIKQFLVSRGMLITCLRCLGTSHLCRDKLAHFR